jgi:hypothetical protein
MRNIRLVLTVNGKLLGSAIVPKHSIRLVLAMAPS